MYGICGNAHPRKCTMTLASQTLCLVKGLACQTTMTCGIMSILCYVAVVVYSVPVKGNCVSIFGYFCKITYCCTSQSYFRVT